MSEEEENTFNCSLYSSWDNITSSWINVPVKTGDSLVVSLHTDAGGDEEVNYALLVILLNQDILQRIRLVMSSLH